MIDPVLERNLADCSEILDLWRRFHDFMAVGAKGEGISSEREAEFLTVKSRIAMLHDSFMAALQADRNIGQSMLTIVGRAITLHHLARMSVAEVKKMEIEWHQAYLLLQETLGNLEEKRAKLADISEAAYKAERFRTGVKQRFDRITKSNMTIGVLIFGALLFATVGVQVTGIFDWGSLRNFGPTRAVFYVVYDKAVRLVFSHAHYYRLDWVELPVKDEESRAFLPKGFWRFHPEDVTDVDRQAKVDIKREVLPTLGLPSGTLSTIQGAKDYKEIWTFNSQDYICIALFLMDSTAQARGLAEDIRRAVQGTNAHNVGAANRANILMVFYLSEKNHATDSRDAFSEYLSRGADLIW
jgi:hypothetical protein